MLANNVGLLSMHNDMNYSAKTADEYQFEDGQYSRDSTALMWFQVERCLLLQLTCPLVSCQLQDILLVVDKVEYRMIDAESIAYLRLYFED